jgi:hypothetical protein
VAAHATLRASAELIAQLRRQPCHIGNQPLPATFLKHAEDQTVVALTAVARALSRSGWEGRSFADWGVVAAPNFFGRAGMAQTIHRFAEEGAWGISPHLIPHQSLHAVSGTISQALKIYGPNFGIGGGPNSGSDAFLLAATLLTDERLPGLWLVLTGHEQELIPTPHGQPAAPPPLCEGVALAITRSADADAGLNLRVGPGTHPHEAPASEFRLTDFLTALTQPEQATARWRLGAMGWVELDALPGSGGRSR